MTKQVVLFDIDGTLMKTGAGRVSLEEVFDGTGALFDFSFAGMTDCDIISRALESIDITPSQNHVTDWLRRYVPVLERNLGTMPVDPLPGVIEVLDALPKMTVASVGTGNCRAGASAKLRAANLSLDFAFGVFGDLHRSRTTMFRELADFGDQKLVVVGDTPADIAAGRACGATTIAVATGSYSRESLQGADLVVDDMFELIGVF